MSNITFINNQAEFGAAFSYQTTQNTIYTYSHLTFIYDIPPALLTTTVKNQVRLNSGSLILKHIQVPQLNTPFLALTSGNLKIQGMKIQQLGCQANDNSMAGCLFDLDASQNPNVETDHVLSLNVTELTLNNVNTVIPLISSIMAEVLLMDIKVNDVQATNTNIIFASFVQSTVLIDQAILSNMAANVDSTFIQATSSTLLSISNSVFDNTGQAANPTFSTAVHFISQTHGQISVKSTQFTNNSAFFSQTAGVSLFSSCRLFIHNL